MSDIWDLPPEAVENAIAVGYTVEQIDAIRAARRANFNAIKASVQGDMSDKEFAGYYRAKYGIDHVCTCAEDKFLGNYNQVPACFLRFHEQIVDKVEALLPERDALQAAVDSLRMQVAELGDKPRA